MFKAEKIYQHYFFTAIAWSTKRDKFSSFLVSIDHTCTLWLTTEHTECGRPNIALRDVWRFCCYVVVVKKMLFRGNIYAYLKNLEI